MRTAARILLLSLLAGWGILGCSGKEAGKEYAFTNRLAKEKSPYLLQHAHNPVDWYPWGPEALEKAKKEDKPIFLSVGYSTCHWCHVMERESFENEELAAVLNEYFVPIKVDREERPDIDHLYMSAVQAMNNGQGGWPMSVFLTPDLKPFFAGTYFPPDRPGRPGFGTLLDNLHAAWLEHRADIEEQGDRVAEFLRGQAMASPVDSTGLPVDESILREAYERLHSRYDAAGGGFGGAPKFPSPHAISFLFRYAARTGTDDALAMARGTLDAMAAGGIHDHLGGGFHRYSTDAAWLVPHFEKMLYDQAGLAQAYLDGWLVLRDPGYENVVRDICDYVIRDLGHPGGGYYAAEDADSEGEEGRFYVWSAAEIDSILGSERGPAFRARYRAPQGGNWEGKNILHLEALDPAALDEFDADRRALFEAREERVRPHRDEKIITAWNGFMIEAMARAGAALDEPRYLASAVESAEFVLTNLDRDGQLLRHWQGGAADVPGYLDDYAFLGRGFLALYETTFDPRWLEEALRLADTIRTRFARPDAGTFTLNAGDGEDLLAPVVEIHDGALPSANAAAAMLLLELGHLTARPELEEAGWGVIRTLSPEARQAPTAFLALLCALDFRLGPDTEIVVAGAAADETVRAMWQAVRERYLPNAVSAFRPEDAARAEASVRLIPYLVDQPPQDGKATAYVCSGYACRLPVRTVAGLEAELDALRKKEAVEE